MNTTTMRDRFNEKFYNSESNQDCGWLLEMIQGCDKGDEIIEFISNLLTKKDQEHKAKLEMIKGELKELTTSLVSPDYEDYTIAIEPAIEREKALSILDKHINK